MFANRTNAQMTTPLAIIHSASYHTFGPLPDVNGFMVTYMLRHILIIFILCKPPRRNGYRAIPW